MRGQNVKTARSASSFSKLSGGQWSEAFIVVSRSSKTRGLRNPRAAQIGTTADSYYGEDNARPPICAIRTAIVQSHRVLRRFF